MNIVERNGGMAKYPSWVVEHGADYEVPPEISQNVADLSWRNDTCPSFGVIAENGSELRIWVEHPEPDKRENSQDERFCVSEIHNEKPVRWIYTDHVTFALQFYEEWLRDFHERSKA